MNLDNTPNAQEQPEAQPRPPITPPRQESTPSRTLLIVIVVVVLVIIGGVLFALGHAKKNSPTSSTATTTKSSAAFSPASKKACDVFTLTDAQSVLGASAQATPLNGAINSSTADLAISSCGYQTIDGSSAITANVQITGALSQRGLTTNIATFSALKSKDDGAAIAGIGDQAFYDSKVNVLVFTTGNYSVTITYMITGVTTTYDQAHAEQIAKIVSGKL